MSTSMLVHAWGLHGYHLVSKCFQGGAIYLRIQPVNVTVHGLSACQTHNELDDR